MAGYPATVRKGIIELYEQDHTTKQMAELFGVRRSGVLRVRPRLRKGGTYQPLPSASGTGRS